MTYICSYGVVNCPICMPLEEKEKLHAKVPNMRPCGKKDGCKCFPSSEAYTYSPGQECALMKDMTHEKLGMKL